MASITSTGGFGGGGGGTCGLLYALASTVAESPRLRRRKAEKRRLFGGGGRQRGRNEPTDDQEENNNNNANATAANRIDLDGICTSEERWRTQLELLDRVAVVRSSGEAEGEEEGDEAAAAAAALDKGEQQQQPPSALRVAHASASQLQRVSAALERHARISAAAARSGTRARLLKSLEIGDVGGGGSGGAAGAASAGAEALGAALVALAAAAAGAEAGADEEDEEPSSVAPPPPLPQERGLLGDEGAALHWPAPAPHQPPPAPEPQPPPLPLASLTLGNITSPSAAFALAPGVQACVHVGLRDLTLKSVGADALTALTNALASATAAGEAAQLRSLVLTDCCLSSPAAAEALAAAIAGTGVEKAALVRLKYVGSGGGGATTATAAAATASSSSSVPNPSAVVAAVALRTLAARLPWSPRALRELDVSGTTALADPIAASALGALAAAAAQRGGLVRLAAVGCGITDEGLARFADSANASVIGGRRARTTTAMAPAAGVATTNGAAASAGGWAARIELLDVSDNAAGDRGVARLARALALAAAAAAAPPRLSSRALHQQLHQASSPLQPSSQNAAPTVPSRGLGLTLRLRNNGGVGPSAAAALGAAMRAGVGITCLDLSGTRIGGGVAALVVPRGITEPPAVVGFGSVGGCVGGGTSGGGGGGEGDNGNGGSNYFCDAWEPPPPPPPKGRPRPLALTSLDLCRCGVTDVAAQALARGMAMGLVPKLERLALSGNAIGDQGARALVEAAAVAVVGTTSAGGGGGSATTTACPLLSELLLDHNRVRNAGADALVDWALSRRGVRDLRLDHNRVTSPLVLFTFLQDAARVLAARRGRHGSRRVVRRRERRVVDMEEPIATATTEEEEARSKMARGGDDDGAQATRAPVGQACAEDRRTRHAQHAALGGLRAFLGADALARLLSKKRSSGGVGGGEGAGEAGGEGGGGGNGNGGGPGSGCDAASLGDWALGTAASSVGEEGPAGMAAGSSSSFALTPPVVAEGGGGSSGFGFAAAPLPPTDAAATVRVAAPVVAAGKRAAQDEEEALVAAMRASSLRCGGARGPPAVERAPW